MRVLWFTNSPASARELIGSGFVGEGWIGALEKAIVDQSNISLGIAFQSVVNSIEIKDINRVKYYIMPLHFGRFKRRIGPGVVYKIGDESSIEYYLNIIRDFKPDILQIFGSESNFGLVIPHIKTPVVIHIQGNITVYNHKFFSGLSKFELIRYSSWKDLLRGNSQVQKYHYLKRVEKREKDIFRACKYFMGRTRWDKNISRVLSPESNYYHCDEVLRDDFFSVKWERKETDMFRLITIIRGDIYKGLDTVMETASILKSLHQNFEWLIVGLSANDQSPRIFEKKYNRSFSEVNVHFLGSKDVNELIDLFLNSSIFIHPSHIENSSNSICEAMMIGIPVISTATGGTSDILKNGEEGILIQDGDPYAMTGAILELSNDLSLQDLFSKNARKTALTRHNPLRILNQLESIYEEVIKDHNKVST